MKTRWTMAVCLCSLATAAVYGQAKPTEPGGRAANAGSPGDRAVPADTGHTPPGGPAPAGPRPGIDAVGLGKLLDGTTLKHELLGDRTTYKVFMGNKAGWFLGASPSGNGQFVWLVVGCPSYKEAPAHGAALLELLGENRRMGVDFFAYVKKGTNFTINVPIPAAGLTSEGLAAEVKSLDHQINRTAGLWDATMWTGGEAWQDGDPGPVGPTADRFSSLPGNTDAFDRRNDRLKALLSPKFKVVDDPGASGEFAIVQGNLKEPKTILASMPDEGPFLWLSYIAAVVPDGPPDAEALLKLLAENGRKGMYRFAYEKERRRLVLLVPVLTEGLTPEKLAAEVDALDKEALRTSRLWDVRNWKAAPVKK